MPMYMYVCQIKTLPIALSLTEILFSSIMQTYASWQGLFVPYIKKIVSNLHEGMDICPFEYGHLSPLYKSANLSK